MSLSPGTRLGPYEVVAQVGVGGMGEVYRATDTNLKRAVAIKVLPGSVAGDAERLARFQREAEVLASLNDPHIAAIYGLERSGSTTALVMELVEGEDLSQRLARGPIPVDDALAIAKQIADALEAAHEQGIIHRDLKPANIALTVNDQVKVLDFGLAKAMEPEASGAELANSPTLTSPAVTRMGVILGTAAYMAPERAKGRPADRRSDIWAFGAVLYEMLTGTRAFAGDDVSDTLVSVLRDEPDWTRLPTATPAPLHRLLRRCLQKDRHERLESAADARLEIQDALSSSLGDERPATLNAVFKPSWRAIPVLITATIGVLASGAVWIARRPASQPPPLVTRFPVTFGTDRPLDTSPQQQVVISPDGSQLVYAGAGQLYRRAMSEVDARPIAGTQFPAVANPVFSPDGQFLAFIAVEGAFIFTVKKIAVAGGNATALGTLGQPPFGMSWNVGGILVGQVGDGIVRVSPNGGSPERVISLAAGERAYGPQLLPDGQTILFTLATRSGGEGWDDTAQIVVQSLKTGERTTLHQGGSDGRYLPTGHLVYANRGVVFAVPFDPGRRAIAGTPVPVVEGVLRSPLTGAAQFSVSKTGTLVYLPGPAAGTTSKTDLAWFDRLGEITPLKLPPATYRFPRIAPDGRRVAVQVVDGTESNISVYDLSGASAIRRLTFGGHNQFPVWSSDGERIAFQSDREGDAGVFWQRADGAGPAERLTKPDAGTAHIPSAMSPDGRWLLLRAEKENRSTLWTLSVADRKTALLSEVPSTLPSGAVFSPDGRWIAFVEGEGSARGVYVQPFPATGARYEVAKGGQSFYPVWSQHGEIFFISEIGSFGLVRVTTQPAVSFGPFVGLPRSRLISTVNVARIYDVTPDGKRSIWAIEAEAQSAAPGSTQLQVVLNWYEELNRLVPTLFKP